MRVTLRVCFYAYVLMLSVFLSGSAAGQGAPESLVAIAPCRILDTAATPSAEGEVTRQIDFRSSRCSRIVPPVATAYSLRVTRTSRVAPEKLPAGVTPVIDTPRRVPAAADGRLSFPIPSEEYVGVDVVGYYVLGQHAGGPNSATTDSDGGAALRSDAAPAKGGDTTNVVYSGSAGDIFLDGALWSPAGIYMRAAATNPWIIAQLGNSDGSSAFYLSSSTAQLMHVRSDGVLSIPTSSFVDGRTDFFGTPGSYYGNVSVPTNVIHDVTLVNPRDASGGSASRLTFFNAFTWDEVGSPPITKFHARSGGYYGQENVNFDSTFHWHHQSNQYHFRAGSTGENKTTFWVKAVATNPDATNHRADMYVSGRVGIGTTTPAVPLHVEDLTNDVSMILSAGDNPGAPNAPTLILMRKDGYDEPVAKYGLQLDADDGNRFKLLYGGAGAFSGTLLTVDPNGNVGMGGAPSTAKLNVTGSVNVTGNIVASGAVTGATVVGAVYQDLAEWVPATVDMAPGTVVVLNTEKTNEVMPSALEYDGRVAGVISAQPGLLLGVEGQSKEMVATTGRVKVKVDATRAPIQIGDLLVSSSKPGTAMKSVPIDVGGVAIHRPGTIIGKALEPLRSGQGEILVLLSLQ